MLTRLPVSRGGLVTNSVLLTGILAVLAALAVAGLLGAASGRQGDLLIPLLLLTLLILLLGAALAYRLALAVRRPALALAEAVDRWGEGDFTHPIPPVGEPELAALAQRLEAARLSLKANLESVAGEEARHAELSSFREQLLYSVAHELRGPLSVLENSLEILATEYGDLSTADFDRMMHSSRRTVIRLHSMMEELLSAGSIQAGRFQVQPSPVELSALVAEALDLVEPMVEGRSQRVLVEPPGGHPRVLGDRRYLRQVLSNLVGNASKYSPEGAVIRVEVTRGEGQVRVAVRDTGPGIPAEQRVGLFERFYRVRGGTEQPGIGLGLAIAKGIVDAHGGSIGVESEVGVGTTVWLTLPEAPESRE